MCRSVFLENSKVSTFTYKYAILYFRCSFMQHSEQRVVYNTFLGYVFIGGWAKAHFPSFKAHFPKAQTMWTNTLHRPAIVTVTVLTVVTVLDISVKEKTIFLFNLLFSLHLQNKKKKQASLFLLNLLLDCFNSRTKNITSNIAASVCAALCRESCVLCLFKRCCYFTVSIIHALYELL